jgi:hypothetical protein
MFTYLVWNGASSSLLNLYDVPFEFFKGNGGISFLGESLFLRGSGDSLNYQTCTISY